MNGRQIHLPWITFTKDWNIEYKSKRQRETKGNSKFYYRQLSESQLNFKVYCQQYNH